MSEDSRDTSTEPSRSPSADDIFELLSHHRRRYVVGCLDQYGSPVSLADLADECVVMEHQCALDDIPAETVTRMYMSLYHCHVPKLAAGGVIEYDQAHDLVRAGSVLSQLHAQIELTRTPLSGAAESALETLRGAIDTDCGLAVAHTRELLENAGYKGRVEWLLDRLEHTGYIHFVEDCVRIV